MKERLCFSHFNWISPGEASWFCYRNQCLHQVSQKLKIITDIGKIKNQIFLRLPTSRFTAKIAQCLPITSCHTVLDWNNKIDES